MSSPASVYLGLGTNLGDRLGNLSAALECLQKSKAVHVTRLSSVYETAPLGYTDQGDFLNAVGEAQTQLDPHTLLQLLLNVEHALGRVRDVRWGPRRIDLDILLYGTAVIDDPGLTVPHPRMYERGFVVAPLAELRPDLCAPDGRPLPELAIVLAREQSVRRTGLAIDVPSSTRDSRVALPATGSG